MLWPAVTFNRGLLVRLISGLTGVLGTLCCAFLQRVSSSSRRASSMLHGLAGTIAGRTTDCFLRLLMNQGHDTMFLRTISRFIRRGWSIIWSTAHPSRRLRSQLRNQTAELLITNFSKQGAHVI